MEIDYFLNMKYLLLFLFVFISAYGAVVARVFQEVIKARMPKVTKVHNVYYMVTSDNSTNDRIAIYTSPNLQAWKFENFVFTTANFPVWISNTTTNVWGPMLCEIGGSYRIYFYAANAERRKAIGVAAGPTPTGPFKDIGKPLLEENGQSFFYPFVVTIGKFKI